MEQALASASSSGGRFTLEVVIGRSRLSGQALRPKPLPILLEGLLCFCVLGSLWARWLKYFASFELSAASDSSLKFNLPVSLVEAIPEISGHDTAVLMHNDGVSQGLFEAPFMQDVEHWGVLTIGTGLGNARFTYRRAGKADKAKEDK